MTLGTPPRRAPHATQAPAEIVAPASGARGAMSAMPVAAPWGGAASAWASSGAQYSVSMKMPR